MLPIACSLSAADLSARLRDMAELGREALLGVDVQPRRAELRFAPGVRERLERIAAAESECCAFLTLRVDGDAVLRIEAPEGAEPVLAELVAAFRQT